LDAPAAVLPAVEAAVELLEEPQAARTPSADTAPAAFRKLRREIMFFIVLLLLVRDVRRVYATRPGGTGKRLDHTRAAPRGGRTLSPSWRAGARTTVWAGAPCSICRISSSTQRVAISSVGWTIEARAGTQKRDMGMPSKPITDTSSGTLYPALARARMTPMAMTSLMAKTAVNWARRASRPFMVL